MYLGSRSPDKEENKDGIKKNKKENTGEMSYNILFLYSIVDSTRINGITYGYKTSLYRRETNCRKGLLVTFGDVRLPGVVYVNWFQEKYTCRVRRNFLV